MENPLSHDEAKIEDRKSVVHKIYGLLSDGIHFAAPFSDARANEADVVRGLLKMLQGFSSYLFYWDHRAGCFGVKSGIYVVHLSRTSLHAILSQFSYAATCLQLVDIIVGKVEMPSRLPPPTLKAFASCVSSWIRRLRDVALKEEMKMSSSDNKTFPTLLGLASSLSSLCAGAEYLLDIVHGAIPPSCLEVYSSVTASEVAVHILDYLYKRLDEACLVQGGEEEAYQMLLHLFVGSVQPYIQGLDSWLYEGILDDPFEEMFFYANKAISVEDPEIWEKSYLMRQAQRCNKDAQQINWASARDHVPLKGDKKEITDSMSGKKEGNDGDLLVYPIFLKDIAKSVISAGKSLQLIRHVSPTSSAVSPGKIDYSVKDLEGSVEVHELSGLTLSETFCTSVAGLIGHGGHVERFFWQEDSCKSKTNSSFLSGDNQLEVEKKDKESLLAPLCSEKIWDTFFTDAYGRNREIASEYGNSSKSVHAEEVILASETEGETLTSITFYPENPVITLCHPILNKNTCAWKSLNISKSFCLPPLNDEDIWKAIFGEESGPVSRLKGTDFALGFQFGGHEYLHAKEDDTNMLEGLFPFPTLLPSVQEGLPVSRILPFQKNSTLPSRVLQWIQNVEPETTPLPLAVMQECLVFYIKKQVDLIGKQILSKLILDWRLMDELAVLRAIYLLGSGDLLQHFLAVIFNKLDRGETWDDEFDLNTILQESISNSADGNLLSAPDSLVVSITRTQGPHADEQHNNASVASPKKSNVQRYGIDGLASLKFTYKVSWPLELIANTEAIKKYNQIMGFLLKVKRAKFALDKARRWMWKGKRTASYRRKNHWLVEQKLLHFVDAFHQYVMDRVYHSAWRELCEGMAAARSLDEVMEVHEAYLLSIQRQCFVVPDKLWALIASRINSILGLALDFYSIQQTLSSGGAVSTIKARCEVEVERIEKQFDGCIAFLLRILSFKLNVGHFPHLADLVTRINYNYYYMSDSGNLKTTSAAAETVASRSVKPFSG
ncbi:hypothetical protein CDL15_Pgr006789 [Punica granatum]|uniref:Gamma-tubulin complex component n=2 Tax=Punica granatum TaxID=22663 RepID=A0A218X7U4_PUNGR|nr:hypothetical protein CDL15_Pgr006789 [Punica granatum]